MQKEIIIRQMDEKDLDKITEMHMLIRPKETTMLTRLGKNFWYDLIKIIYRTEPEACFIVQKNKEIIGYFLGTSDFKRLNRNIITKIGPFFIPKLIIGKYNPPGNLFTLISFVYSSLKHSVKRGEYNKSIKAEEIEIAVLPGNQRKGIASSLVDKFFSYIKSKNIEKIQVFAYEKEPNSVKFHSKFYTPVNTLKTPMGQIIHFVADLKKVK